MLVIFKTISIRRSENEQTEPTSGFSNIHLSAHGEHWICRKTAQAVLWLAYAKNNNRYFGSAVSLMLNLVSQSFHANIVLFIGNPGAGKTILAGSLIDELENNTDSNLDFPCTVCYYFFSQSSTSKSTRVSAYQAIAQQIFRKFHQEEKIHSIFAMASSLIDLGQRCSEAELIETLELCLARLPNLCIILDGIDECNEQEKLKRDLLRWCTEFPTKIVIFSRPDVASLRKAILPSRIVQIRREDVYDDIESYFKTHLMNLVEEDLLPDEPGVIDRAASYLIIRADGMFLWARLMIGFLNAPGMTKQQRVDVVMENSPDRLDRLDDMYCRILARIESLDQYSRSLATKALTWAAHASVTSSEMMEAIHSTNWEKDREGYSKQFDHAVIVSCCGLVEKRHTGQFQLIHLTAREFLEHASRNTSSANHRLLTGAQAKCIIASRCVAYLADSVPHQPLSGNLAFNVDAVAIQKQFPFLRFCTENWLLLVLDVTCSKIFNIEEEGVLGVVNNTTKLLQRRLCLMMWVEAGYTIFGGYFDTLVWKIHAALSTQLSITTNATVRCLVSQLKEFIGEIRQLQSSWGATLALKPCEIWGDTTAFQKCRFLQATQAVGVERLTDYVPPEQCKALETQQTPTFSISMSSADGIVVAVLGIYPSR